MYKGIDISTMQGNVDMTWVKNQGNFFVMNRCYVGNDYKDAAYDGNVAKEKAVGLLPAAYHFVYPLPASSAHPNRDAVGQANLHFTAANGELAAVDAEWPPSTQWAQWGCSATQINDWLLQYMERYTQLSGQKMLFYTYPSWAQSVGFTADFAQYSLWIASYTSNPSIPSPWPDYYMWQTAGGSQLTLPSGATCDTDVVKDLSWWGATVAPSVVSEPALAPPIEVVPSTPALVPASAPVVAASPLSPEEMTIIQKVLAVVVQVVKTLFHIP